MFLVHVICILDRLATVIPHGSQPPMSRRARQLGQSTAEYALVLLGAATVALVFIAWAGKTSRIGSLFNAVLDTVIGKV